MSVSSYHDKQIKGYYKLEDFRTGFKIAYNDFDIKTDIGIGGSGVAIKDLLLTYYKDKNTITFGNGYDPFSMEMLTSSVSLRFHQSATSALAFINNRKLGITYHLNESHLYFGTGLYTNNDINEVIENQLSSLVTTSRLIFRTDEQSDITLHFGAAYSYRSKPKMNDDINQSIKSPGITSLFGEPLLKAEWSNWSEEQKGVIEALAIWSRFMVQGEYYMNRYSHVGPNNSSYKPYGGYIQGGFLIIGRGFDYDRIYAIPGRPTSNRALELTARANYTNLNSTSSGIYGGKEYDFSLGLNFYLNKNIGIKLNGSYVSVIDSPNSFYSNNLCMGQLRIQYIF